MIHNFAHIWEVVSEAAGDRLAAINGDRCLTWRDYEDRSARLAAAMADHDIGQGARIAIYAYNRNEYLEAQFAAFKLRAVPININYRYAASELEYLLDNADAEAIVYEARFAPLLDQIRDRLPKLRLFIEIADDSSRSSSAAESYESLIAHSARLPRRAYSADDIYMIYTGGTTGMPKGVIYHHGDIVPTMLVGFDFRGLPRPDSDDALRTAVTGVAAAGEAPVSLVACPMMHGAGMWSGVMMPHNLGGTVVSIHDGHFDADRLWRTAEREGVTEMAIVGDAFARPMLASLRAAEAAGRPFQLPRLKWMFSSGVMFSHEVKRELVARLGITIVDSAGSSEGHVGISITSPEDGPETATFTQMPTTKVFAEDDTELEAGSDAVGRLASGGLVPRAYHKDPAKSAATFRTIDGHRYSFSGDYARINADGSFTLLGRGSNCINSGGEKIFPEEVEEAIKALSGITDCLVVGVADDRFGEVPAALIAIEPGIEIEHAALVASLRATLAGYKIPRHLHVTETIPRAPNGKPDYPSAKAKIQSSF